MYRFWGMGYSDWLVALGHTPGPEDRRYAICVPEYRRYTKFAYQSGLSRNPHLPCPEIFLERTCLWEWVTRPMGCDSKFALSVVSLWATKDFVGMPIWVPKSMGLYSKCELCRALVGDQRFCGHDQYRSPGLWAMIQNAPCVVPL